MGRYRCVTLCDRGGRGPEPRHSSCRTSLHFAALQIAQSVLHALPVQHTSVARTSPHLTSPHLISPHRISPHLPTYRCISLHATALHRSQSCLIACCSLCTAAHRHTPACIAPLCRTSPHATAPSAHHNAPHCRSPHAIACRLTPPPCPAHYRMSRALTILYSSHCAASHFTAYRCASRHIFALL